LEKLSIKVNIANRVYPLNIEAQGEEMIREAGRQVNENIRNLEQTYSVEDKQDLLAMAALYFANKCLILEDRNNLLKGEIAKEVLQMDNELSKVLGLV